ncbi:MAG: hypothetical protein AB1630_03930 [bacterium]
MYEVFITENVEREIRNIPKNIIVAIDEKIRNLPFNPRSIGCKRLWVKKIAIV